MKILLIPLYCLLLLGGCIGHKEEILSGEFTFPDTGLSLIVPANWLKTNIPGNPYPVLFTEVNYGIKPNIQLESYSRDIGKEVALENYLNRKKKMYSDYSVIARSAVSTKSNVLRGSKITARRTNNDNIPIIHVSYVFNRGAAVYILSATCAEPSLSEYESIFDKTINSLEIKK